MKENKHTRGEWTWDGDPTNYDKETEAPWLVTEAGKIIISGEIMMHNIHDVKLIASAPKMLEALWEVINSTEFPMMETKTQIFVQEAITQALGE